MVGPTLLHEAIDAHGGLDRWAGTHQIKLQARIGGNILALKFRSPRTRSLACTIDTRRVHAVLEPFPRAGLLGVFEADQLTIQTGEGRIVARRAIVRTADGRVPRRPIWGDLDLLYFLGYALWNYTVAPYVFLWPGFECHEGPVWHEPDGSCWRTLLVRHPPRFPTHCRNQTFYFDDRGLLRRLDYTAEVFSERARGAHLCNDHRTFDGFVLPTHRIVYPRRASGQPVRVFRVMEGWIDQAVIF